ncbi:MAG: cyclic lactone autoinducer peptide [Bacillota bacterium]
MLKRIFDVLAAILTVLAIATASSACWIFFYQPRTPKSLLKN